MAKLLMQMMLHELADVTKCYVQRVRTEKRGVAAARAAMPSRGFEQVDCGSRLTPDGREILYMYGMCWALRQEVHAKQLADVFDKKVGEQQVESADSKTKSVAGTDSLAPMTCPKCGDSLQYSKVCGACAAGKAGYRHRYACVRGCVDFVSKEKV